MSGKRMVLWIIFCIFISQGVFAYDGDGSVIGSVARKSVIGNIIHRANEEKLAQQRGSGSGVATSGPEAVQQGIVASIPGQRAHMSNSKNARPEDDQGVNSNVSFAKVVRNKLPMTTEQIKDLHSLLDQSKRAISEYPGVPPKPTSSSVMVNLSPGQVPPLIRLRRGYVTSVVFLDATGQPWPIHAYDLGDTERFNIQWDKKGDTLLVQALSTYQQGNLAVMLKGLNTPVMITLMPGQTAVDYRVDMRIPKLGPNALAAKTQDLPGTADPRLLSVLDGIPPEGAVTLDVSKVGVQAWLMGSSMFIRSPDTVLSPSFSAEVSSDDGMHAYKLSPCPVVLIMTHGRIEKMVIKGF